MFWFCFSKDWAVRFFFRGFVDLNQSGFVAELISDRVLMVSAAGEGLISAVLETLLKWLEKTDDFNKTTHKIEEPVENV